MIPREVAETPYFSEKADQFREVYSLFDHVLDGVCWELARNPTVGTNLPDDPEYYVYKTTAKGRTPAFVVLYSFHETQVQLLSINVLNTD